MDYYHSFISWGKEFLSASGSSPFILAVQDLDFLPMGYLLHHLRGLQEISYLTL